VSALAPRPTPSDPDAGPALTDGLRRAFARLAALAPATSDAQTVEDDTDAEQADDPGVDRVDGDNRGRLDDANCITRDDPPDAG
jgi:hypothetical protein